MIEVLLDDVDVIFRISAFFGIEGSRDGGSEGRDIKQPGGILRDDAHITAIFSDESAGEIILRHLGSRDEDDGIVSLATSKQEEACDQGQNPILFHAENYIVFMFKRKRI